MQIQSCAVCWKDSAVCVLLQKKQNLTGAYYAKLISKLQNALKKKHQGMLKNGVLFHQDNAPNHTSSITINAIYQIGFELEEHLSYLPNLAPSDYWLFPKLKENLRNFFFFNDKLMQVAERWFAKVVQIFFFQEAVEMLEYPWTKSINDERDYVDK